MRAGVHGKDPALLRRINAATTARLLYDCGPLTLTQVVDRTGLSRRTVESVLEKLDGDGLVQRLAPEASAGAVGRPARTYRFRTEAGVVAGLQVSRAEVRATLTDLNGTELATATVKTRAHCPREERVEAIIDCARAVLARARVPRKRLWAVAVGTPGLVLADGVVELCTMLHDWEGFNLAERLTRWFPCPVMVENDVNLSARGEQWRGAAVGLDSLVWVLTGRRSRAAVVIDGSLYRGVDGAAGEIGWLPVLGWSEVRDQARTYAEARAEDRDAAVDTFAHALSRGLAALVLAINPRCLVVGGVSAGSGEPLVAALRRHLEPLCLKVPEIRTSTLADDSEILGAVRIALDDVERQLFSLAGSTVT